MKKNNTLISFVICVLFNGFLHAADCYVLGSANPAFADGTEEHPYNTIQECLTNTQNSTSDTIYIGAGHYNAPNITIGYRTIVGSGVNVTKIHNINNDYCFVNVAGTIRDLSFDSFRYFDNGGNVTCRCNNAIETIAQSGDTDIIRIYNVLFEDHSSYSIMVRSDNVEIRNNVFGVYSGSLLFNQMDNITFMNNLILNNAGFNSLTGSTNHKFHNNLFLNTCSLPEFDGTTYNLVYLGPQIEVNDMWLGDNDSTCGQMGEYQETDDFYTFSDLNLLVDTWNIYNIYASGENTILFDKGNPDTQFNDADGSRSDIGVMGGLYPWPYSSGPVITNFNVEPINVQIDGEINIESRGQTE